MRYYVLSPDGSRFGPADIPTLNEWIAQNRVNPTMMLEDELGTRILAQNVPGLNFGPLTSPPPSVFQPATRPMGQDWSVPPGHSPYPRPGPTTSTGSGANNYNLILAWVMGAITLVACCPILPGVGLFFANKARADGIEGANVARIFNIVILTLSLLLYIGYIVFFAWVFTVANA